MDTAQTQLYRHTDNIFLKFILGGLADRVTACDAGPSRLFLYKPWELKWFLRTGVGQKE